MKKLLFTLMISLVLVACKKDDPEPEPEIAAIVDRWKSTAYENMVNGKKIWVPVDGEPSYISFRFDGLILDSNGLPPCCSPRAYYLNGVLFEVKPKAGVPTNNYCISVDCIGCDTWDIEQTGNELIISLCEPFADRRSKYIRD
jgi:hypothetical protein